MGEIVTVDRAALAAEVSPVLQRANAIAVTNGAERSAAVEFGMQIKTAQKRVHAACDAAVETTDAAHKAAVALRAYFLNPLVAAEKRIKGVVEDYDEAEEAKRKAEEARLQAEADEKARKAREKLEREAEKLKTPELREQRLAEAAAIIAPVVTVAPAYERSSGEATKRLHKARLLDKNALIAAAYGGNELAASFLAFDEKTAGAFARSSKGTVAVPGVEFYAEKSTSWTAKG